MSVSAAETASFAGLVDLASERVGGKALLASDEFFAPKENLLKPGRGIFIPDKYTDRGKWMDGWETRRKRVKGYDWCIMKLGLAGAIKGVDIDTNHFLGNNPAYASIEACKSDSSGAKLLPSKTIRWTELLPKSPLKPGSQNLFSISNDGRWTHLRLNIYPDGGVARLHVFGDVLPDWGNTKKTRVIDLAAVEHGGVVVAASDMFFGSKENLIMPGRAKNMGDGWETKRRRGPGFDWAIVKLGRTGNLKRIEVDTNHFKGNYPDSCSIEFCNEPARIVDALTFLEVQWTEIVARTRLKPDARQYFDIVRKDPEVATHVKLNIFPDGGVSRLRAWGTVVK
jgi:allantoicase